MTKNNVLLFMIYLIIFGSAILMFSVNRYWYRFPGLFYFEPALLGGGILLYLTRFGLKLHFNLDHDTPLLRTMREIGLYFMILTLILFSTSAIQYTPFAPIDKKIVWIEHELHLDVAHAMAWLHQNMTLKVIAKTMYFSLIYQVIVIPLWVMIRQQYDTLYQFYFLLLISWLIGSLTYYFFPTAAPASVIDSPYFIQEQYATGLKFWQLHHYIQPVTADGGLIAMPSFHVIWAWLCVLLLKPWPILFVLLGMGNLILAGACVFLGWHYFLDVAGSVLILIISHYAYSMIHKTRWAISLSTRVLRVEDFQKPFGRQPLLVRSAESEGIAKHRVNLPN